MKHLILFTLLCSACFAGPAIDLVPANDLAATLRTWRKVQPLSYLFINNSVLAPNYAKGDVAMWEEYHGQPINVGDLFIADFPDLKLFNQCREAKAVTATTITTVYGHTIPLTQVRGIVRRMVRVTP
jgi:hypothetical protein